MRSNKTHKIRRRQVHRKQRGGLPGQAQLGSLVRGVARGAIQAASRVGTKLPPGGFAPIRRASTAPGRVSLSVRGAINAAAEGAAGRIAAAGRTAAAEGAAVRTAAAEGAAVRTAAAEGAAARRVLTGALESQGRRFTPGEFEALTSAGKGKLAKELGIPPATGRTAAAQAARTAAIRNALARQGRLVAADGSQLPAGGLAGGNLATSIGKQAATAAVKRGVATTAEAAAEEFGELATEAGEMLEETLPNPSTPLLRQLEEVAAEIPVRPRQLPNISPNGEVGPTEAQIEGILDSIIPGRVLGRAMRLGAENTARLGELYGAEGLPGRVGQFNQAMEAVARGALRNAPPGEAGRIGEALTPARLSGLKSRLFVLFVRNPGQARQVLDLLVGTILPRGGFNGALVDALIADLAANPESALPNLQRRAADLAVRALDVQGAAALARAKGFGWYSSRSLFTLLQAGFGAAAILTLALAGINNADEFAARIGAARRRFGQNHPGAAAGAAAAAAAARDFYQRLAAAMGRGLAIAAGAAGVELPEAPIAQSPPPRPGPVPLPPAEPAQAPPWVWAWADYLGGAVREARRVYRAIVPPMGGR